MVDRGGLGPTTAEAMVVEGSVAQVTGEAVTIDTAEGARTFSLGGATLQDGFGNAIDLSALEPGRWWCSCCSRLTAGWCLRRWR